MLYIIWKIFAVIVKTVFKIALGVLWLALELLRIFIIMFGLVFRVFLIFVDAGTVKL